MTIQHLTTFNNGRSYLGILGLLFLNYQTKCYSFRVKKIFYVITKSNWGGAQRYVYDLSTSLPKDQFDISVVLGKPRQDTVESGKGKLYDALESSGVKLIPIKEFQRDINLFEEIMVLIKLWWLFVKEKPDVIHVNSSKAGGLGVVAGWLAGIKTRVFTVHGWPFNEPRGTLARNIIYFFSKLTVLFATKVIAISRENFDQAILMTKKSKKIVLIHNGVSEINFKTKDEARLILAEQIREACNTHIESQNTWIGTISELTKNKGLEYLVGATSRFLKENPKEDVNVVIIGGGEEKENLQTLIKKEGLEHHVFLVGFIQDANTLLSAFDIFTLTSVKEGNPYVLLEAGLAKKPVIVSNIKGIDDIIDKESGLFTEKGDVVEISKNITLLTNDPYKRESLGNSLYKKVASEFNLEKTLKETIALY